MINSTGLLILGDITYRLAPILTKRLVKRKLEFGEMPSIGKSLKKSTMENVHVAESCCEMNKERPFHHQAKGRPVAVS